MARAPRALGAVAGTFGGRILRARRGPRGQRAVRVPRVPRAELVHPGQRAARDRCAVLSQQRVRGPRLALGQRDMLTPNTRTASVPWGRSGAEPRRLPQAILPAAPGMLP